MKKNLNYICYSAIILIGIIGIIYGFHYEIKQYQFKKNASKTVANIYQAINREDNKQVLYIDFYVDNKKYDGVLVLKNKKILKSTIPIYYDKKNPLNFTTDETNKFGIFSIVFSILLIFIGTVFLILFKKFVWKNKV